jgi:hypothetical protein
MSEDQEPGIELLPEYKDPASGLVAKSIAKVFVGRLQKNRLVLVSFADHSGALYAMSPATARRLAKELKREADSLSQ